MDLLVGLLLTIPIVKKAKKYYLFLMAGYSDEIMKEAKSVIMPKPKTGNERNNEDDDEMKDEDSDEEDNDNEDSDDDDDSDNEKVGMKGKKKRNKVIKKNERYKK